jgi:putative hydrolases of HD superfamily
MDQDALIDLFIETTTLKRLPRTGWGMRGVAHVESVADHSFGVAFMALILAHALNEAPASPDAGELSLDVEKVLVMALLHDLAEVRLTDLPSTAVRLIPREVKSQAEASAMADLLAPLPQIAHLRTLWHEFEDQTSPEGRLVRDADKLEMMVQCLRYEQAGSRGLEEFWQAMDHHAWHYGLSAELYARLKALRPGVQV